MPLIFSEIHNDTKLNDKFPLHLCLCFRDARPLVNVIKNGDLKALKEIVKRNPMSLLIPNEKGWISLHEAAYYGQKECLKIILRGESEIKTSVIENGFYFIHTVLLNLRKTLYQYMLIVFNLLGTVIFPTAHPGIVNTCGTFNQTPLLLAAIFHHVNCVECLLDRGANPNIANNDGETPLLKGK